MVGQRPVGGKVAAELAAKRHCVKPPVPLPCFPVPNHAVT
jgi:hypothetical protein